MHHVDNSQVVEKRESTSMMMSKRNHAWHVSFVRPGRVPDMTGRKSKWRQISCPHKTPPPERCNIRATSTASISGTM